jgi:hypothetical protein
MCPSRNAVFEKRSACCDPVAQIGRDAAESLRAEARRRADAGEFFGHISYVSVVGRKASQSGV